jgi:hypothetical protein
MTKVLWVLGIIAVVFGGYKVWEMWDSYDKEKDLQAAEAAKREVRPEYLSGLPSELRDSFNLAEKNGVVSMKNWLKTYGAKLEDPRKAWIELDYMVAVAKDDPAEARKIFAMVESRVGTNSPVYPRVQQLKTTYGN